MTSEQLTEKMMSAINWQETWDDDDNSIWEGLSPFTTDSDPEAGPNVYWRLKQEVFGNKIQWYQAHDAELGGVDHHQTWATLDEAKSDCQKAHDNILLTEESSQDSDQ